MALKTKKEHVYAVEGPDDFADLFEWRGGTELAVSLILLELAVLWIIWYQLPASSIFNCETYSPTARGGRLIYIVDPADEEASESAGELFNYLQMVIYDLCYSHGGGTDLSSCLSVFPADLISSSNKNQGQLNTLILFAIQICLRTIWILGTWYNDTPGTMGSYIDSVIFGVWTFKS